MSNISRAWISLLLAAIVLLIIIMTMPIYKIEPATIFLPSSNKPPYHGPVAVYLQRDEPPAAQPLGFINLRLHTDQNFYANEQNQASILNQLKETAAKHGGNAIVVDTFYGPLGQGPMQILIAEAKVIYTS